MFYDELENKIGQIESDLDENIIDQKQLSFELKNILENKVSNYLKDKILVELDEICNLNNADKGFKKEKFNQLIGILDKLILKEANKNILKSGENVVYDDLLEANKIQDLKELEFDIENVVRNFNIISEPNFDKYKEFGSIVDKMTKTMQNKIENTNVWESAQNYRYHIYNIFKIYGIPPALAELPFVESSYNVYTANSIKGAGGLWQFMPSTAKRFGLIVNDEIDERKDIIKSTHVAAKYLKTLYEDFRDLYNKKNQFSISDEDYSNGLLWAWALTSYNKGKVTDKEFGNGNIESFLKKCNRESKEYAAKLFATLRIAKKQEDMEIVQDIEPEIKEFDIVKIENFVYEKHTINKKENVFRLVEKLISKGKYTTLDLIKSYNGINDFTKLKVNQEIIIPIKITLNGLPSLKEIANMLGINMDYIQKMNPSYIGNDASIDQNTNIYLPKGMGKMLMTMFQDKGIDFWKDSGGFVGENKIKTSINLLKFDKSNTMNKQEVKRYLAGIKDIRCIGY